MAKLRAVVFQDGERYIVQCVERDVAAQGETFDAMLVGLARTLSGYVIIGLAALDRDPFECLPPAPDEYEALFDGAQHSLNTLHVPLPEDWGYPPVDVELRLFSMEGMAVC